MRALLRRAGYDERGLERTVRDRGRVSLREGVAVLRLRPDANDRLVVLARLFLGGETVDEEVAAAALAPLALDELPDFLSVGNAAIRARVQLEPFHGLLIASDPRQRLRRGHVVGIGGGTRIVAALGIRRPGGSVVDLCTGSGALALLAAARGQRVIGVDLNRRALRLARLNAELNGVEGIDWRQGDLYEPVAGERFDLVVANPPFVISPGREFLFRDAEHDDDALSRAVVGGAGAHLREGGFACTWCSWVIGDGERWSKALRGWVRASGCDGWLLHDRTDTPLHTRCSGTSVRDARSPMQLPRRRSGWSTTPAEDRRDRYRYRGPAAPCGSELGSRGRVLAGAGRRRWRHVERVFAGEDLLRSLRDGRDLLELRLVPAPNTMVIERRAPSGALERARLAVEEGLPLPARMAEACARVVAALDGRRTVREVAPVLGERELRLVVQLTLEFEN